MNRPLSPASALSSAPIAVTMGEPAGIGGELTLAAWMQRHEAQTPPFYALDCPERLRALAERLRWTVPIHVLSDPTETAQRFATALPVLPIALAHGAQPGIIDPANGAAVLRSIDLGVTHVRTGSASALVTNPIQKATLYRGGFPYPGHTEYLAALAGDDSLHPVMMLACPQLRVALVTVHLPLRAAITALSTDRIVRVGRIVAAALQTRFGIAAPRLAVAGLNPHAGEEGALGREEIDIVAPAVARLQADGIGCHGPVTADALFHTAARRGYDAAVCLYHDQGLIALKTLDFAGGVNITLGLPFIRTSPDHGVALDIAGQGRADPTSFLNALRQAAALAASRPS